MTTQAILNLVSVRSAGFTKVQLVTFLFHYLSSFLMTILIKIGQEPHFRSRPITTNKHQERPGVLRSTKIADLVLKDDDFRGQPPFFLQKILFPNA